jgi:hypothetical protein
LRLTKHCDIFVSDVPNALAINLFIIRAEGFPSGKESSDNDPSARTNMAITLSNITIYPIKSCGGISLDAALLEPRGLQYDRRWMLVDDDGMFISQRTCPRMALIEPRIGEENLEIEAPDMEPLLVPLVMEHHVTDPVQVWNDAVEAVSVGDEASEWFSEFLGDHCKLVAMTESSVRYVDETYAHTREQVSFADGFPLLLLSEASLADLNSRLAKLLPMNRFRPNLVVKGCSAYAEDSWNEISVGTIRLRVVKPCARCVIPTTDQRTGERDVEPLLTLATYRKRDNKIFFGQNVLPIDVGMLRVGDECRSSPHENKNVIVR